MDVLKLITSIITKVTVEIVKDDMKNISLVKKTQFKTTYVLFTIINYFRLHKNINGIGLKEIFNVMSEDGLIPKSMNEYFNNYVNIFDKEILPIICEINRINEFDATNLYQQMLSCNVSINSEKSEIIYDNTSRNILGSYYTPHKLAYEVTKKTLDSFLEKHLKVKEFSNNNTNDVARKTAIEIIMTTKIADLSCGGGDFLLAAVKYTKECLKASETEIKKISTNMYGIDVDPIAIQLAISNLLVAGASIDIVNNFHIGNPLLFSSSYDVEEKFEYASNYRLYNENMGLNLKAIFNMTKFDIILGNPPWEKVRFEERKFFKNISSEIANTASKAQRANQIENLKFSNPSLYKYYCEMVNDYDEFKRNVKFNTLLDRSLSGELNTYSLFAELTTNLLSNEGIAALILKGSIATSPANSELFKSFLDKDMLKYIYFFSNKKKIFKIDSREKFCIIIFEIGNGENFIFAPGLTDIDRIKNAESININSQILNLINPITELLPNVNNIKELSILINVHRKYRTFQEVFPECRYGRLVHLTTHAKNISKCKQENNISIYEGKFIEQYDGRFSTFKGMFMEDKYKGKATSKIINETSIINYKELPEVRYYIEKDKWESITKNYNEDYSLMWRSLTSSTNRRTMVATILPHIPACQSIQFLQLQSKENLLIILALFNSVVFDYLIRLKLSSIDLTQSIINQIPVPEKEAFERVIEFEGQTNTIKCHIFNRIASLYQYEDRLKELWDGIGYKIKLVTSKEKKVIMSQLDVLISIAYSIDIKDLLDILEKFSSFYAKEEVDFLF